jgi:hypothetical protein
MLVNCWPSKNRFYILVKKTTNVIYPLIQPACQQLWYIYCEFIYGKWNICFQAYSISLWIIVDVRVCRLLLYTTDQLMYPTGTRLGQILHARLRMQCSSLNHHLFRKNIVNSPFCQCGAKETTAHFLLHSPRHNATRLRYIHTINLPINLNTDLLLFSSTDLTNTLNTDIFLNVQRFIISSKRFTS